MLIKQMFLLIRGKLFKIHVSLFVRLQMHIQDEALHLHMCRNPWIFEFMKPRVAAKHLQSLRSLRVNEDSGSCHVNKTAVEDQRTSPVHIGNEFL